MQVCEHLQNTALDPSGPKDAAAATFPLPARISDVFLEVNAQLGKGRPFQEILDFLFDGLAHWIPFDRAGVALVEEEEGCARSVWVRSKAAVRHLDLGYRSSLAGSSLRNVLEDCRPRIIGDLDAYFREHPRSESTRLALADGIRSNLTCPLIVANRPVGFVFFSSFQTGTYNAGHIELFSGIAQEVALIVGFGRLQDFFEQNRDRVGAMRKAIHDLRSPASIIKSYLNLAGKREWFRDAPEELKNLLAIIGRNADFMLQMVEEIREIDSQRRSGLAEKAEKVDLGPFLQEMEDLGRLMAEKKGIAFQSVRQLGGVSAWVFSRNGIRRVLENLLSNAVKYSHAGTTILLQAEAGNGKLVFLVRDQGEGIRPEEISRLFREFGRTSTQPTAGEFSTGLGLSIARSIVEAHGGKIRVESKKGAGSTFLFELPAGS
jgi:signal transduction histidine kinase